MQQAKLIINKKNNTNKQIFPLSMCCSIIKSKKSKNYGKLCGRRGKIVVNERHYCGHHMKKKKLHLLTYFQVLGLFIEL